MERYTNKKKLFKHISVTLTCSALTLSNVAFAAQPSDDPGESGVKTIYIMHTGDLHGDTVSHPNARGDATGILEGGLARAATVIKKIKKDHKGEIVWGHTGDTIQGSGVATYTQGKALVDVWDALSPDVFATGNWEYVYGLYRYQQLFGTNADIKPIDPSEYGSMFMVPEDPSGNVYAGFNPDRAFKTDQNGESRRWATIAANAYYNGEDVGPGVVAKDAGEYFTDPYLIKEVNGIRIGFIGCTTNRGPQVVSSAVTKGVTFTNCMGDVKFPQNKPIQWGKDGAHEANRDEPAEVTDVYGGNNAAKAVPGKTVKGFATVPEIVKFTQILRAPEGSDTGIPKNATENWEGEGVDIVVVMSEAGIPENLWNAERTVMPAGVRFPEVILSSDTHERTRLPVVATNPDGNKTVIIEEGEDGMQVGLLKLTIDDGKLETWEWERYDIDETVKEDKEIADLIDDAQAPFTSVAGGGDWQAGDEFVNPFNGYTLTTPLDYAMADTQIILERNRFSYEHDPEGTGANGNPADGVFKMPADVEGTLHDVFTDSFRVLMDTDVGALRGFRYNNTIMPGPITMKDVYHSMTIGAMVASGNIPFTPKAEKAGVDAASLPSATSCIFGGATPDNDVANPATNDCHRMAWPRSLIMETELAANGSQRPQIPQWSGGWLFNYSGINYDFEVFAGNFNGFGKAPQKRVTDFMLVDSAGNPRYDLNDPAQAAAWEAKKLGEVSYASYYYDADWNRINRNQVVSPGKCAVINAGNGGYNRSCADLKDMKILVKVGKEYGAQMAWVTSTQYSKRKTDQVDGYGIYPLDVVEAFGRYVKEGAIDIIDLRSGTASVVPVQGLGGAITAANFGPTFPRYNLQTELVDGRDEFGFGVIQPMRGAPYTGDNVAPAGPVDTPDDEGHF